MTTRTPLPTIRSSSAEKPGRPSVFAADGLVAEFVDDLKPGPLGEAVDRGALAFLAVLVGADVGERTRSVIGQSCDPVFVGNGHLEAPSLLGRWQITITLSREMVIQILGHVQRKRDHRSLQSGQRSDMR
jgi:hypothetical protein